LLSVCFEGPDKINKNKLQYLEKKPHQSELVSMRVLYPIKIGIGYLGFCGGRKTREPREKPSLQGKNQQQTQSMPCIAPSLNLTRGRRGALSSLNHPYFLKILVHFKTHLFTLHSSLGHISNGIKVCDEI